MSHMHVVSTPDHVSIMYQITGKPAVAEADFVGDHWWVARVNVPLSMGRGNGIGTTIVLRMLREIKKQRNEKVVVAPGGYGGDYSKQRRFYKRCGFVEETSGIMVMEVTDV